MGDGVHDLSALKNCVIPAQAGIQQEQSACVADKRRCCPASQEIV
jgi:hypothetical protein